MISHILVWGVPFRYFFASRAPTASERLAWLLTYLLPVMITCALASAGRAVPGVLLGVSVVLVVYSAYEYGYLYNDSITVRGETNPTVRLDTIQQSEVARVLPVILAFRVCIIIAGAALGGFTAAHYGRDPLRAGALCCGLAAAVLGVYIPYNRVRSRVSIALFFCLVALRFCSPAIAVSSMDGAKPLLWVTLLAAYPLPNAIEFAGSKRFGLAPLQTLRRHVDRWRVGYYGIALLAMAFVSALNASARPALGAIAYFFVYRLALLTIAATMRRQRDVRRAAHPPS